MELRHASPRKLDDNLGEFWLENPFDFQRLKGFNLSMFERNRLFFNQGDCVFADVSHISATDIDADSRSVAVGDLNEDGRPDLVVRGVGGGPLQIFLNRITEHRSLHVTLRGNKSNPEGIGARIQLTIVDHTLVRDHFPQNSYSSQNATETIFGIGGHQGPMTLSISWPSGHKETHPVEAGRLLFEEPEPAPQQECLPTPSTTSGR